MAGRQLSAGIVDVDRTRTAIRMQQETNEAAEREIERGAAWPRLGCLAPKGRSPARCRHCRK
jgi:hypothetical protein